MAEIRRNAAGHHANFWLEEKELMVSISQRCEEITFYNMIFDLTILNPRVKKSFFKCILGMNDSFCRVDDGGFSRRELRTTNYASLLGHFFVSIQINSLCHVHPPPRMNYTVNGWSKYCEPPKTLRLCTSRCPLSGVRKFRDNFKP